jgi:hypothetical protein
LGVDLPTSVLERPAPRTLLGSVTPRLWTPPLRELTPATSVGFNQIEFARDMLHRPADPWQEWLLVHAGELLADGRPRFRIVVVLVARQNGKTETLVILSTYWQFVEARPLILGTSTKLEYAKESWAKAVKLVEQSPDPDLAELRPKRWTREANGEQESWTTERSRYKIAASNEEGGRSLTIDRLILDELRQHHDYKAWDAAEPATSAVWDAQIWALSNAGDDRSIVLNDLRDSALDFIRWTEEVGADNVAELLDQAPGDYRLGLFEWSAPEDSDPTDVAALAMANPNLGLRKDPEALLLAARRAVEKGGEVLAGFKTEQMCIHVPALEDPPPISAELWQSLHDAASAPAGDIALGVHVAPDQSSAAIAVFGLRADGRGHVEVVAVRNGAAWVVPAIVKLKALHNPVAIALFGAAGALVEPLARHGITPPVDRRRPKRGDLAVPFAADLAEAWGSFLIAANSDDLRHRDQVPLTAAAGHARAKRAGDAETLDLRGSTGDAGPLNAVLAARWAYTMRADRIVGDLVFEDWNPRVHVVDELDVQPGWRRYLTVRFGLVTPFACQWWVERPDGALIMYREIYMTGRLVEEHAATILDRSQGEPRPVALIADEHAEELPTLRRCLGMGSTAASTSVADGIQAMASRLKARRLLLARDALVEVDRTLAAADLPTCLADELGVYVWAPGKEQPVEEHDAAVVAARQLVAHKDLRKRAGTRGWI